MVEPSLMCSTISVKSVAFRITTATRKHSFLFPENAMGTTPTNKNNCGEISFSWNKLMAYSFLPRKFHIFIVKKNVKRPSKIPHFSLVQSHEIARCAKPQSSSNIKVLILNMSLILNTSSARSNRHATIWCGSYFRFHGPYNRQELTFY